MKGEFKSAKDNEVRFKEGLQEAVEQVVAHNTPQWISVDELQEFFWQHICNSCDCENGPECPEGTDGCFALTLAEELNKKWCPIQQ